VPIMALLKTAASHNKCHRACTLVDNRWRFRFEWDASAHQWVNTKDGKGLVQLLQEEIKAKTGLQLELELP
jgi:Frataxin-like domain